MLSGAHLRTFTHKSTRCQKNNGMTLFHAATRSRITFALALEFAIQKVVSMPILVTCQCGHNLSVPDSMAGKSGKCPKCQQIIKVPVAVTPAKSGQSAPNPQTPAKAGTPAAPAKATGAPANAKGTQASAVAPAAAAVGLGGLLDAAGLTQRTGRFCPACDAPAANTAVICVKCGLNFTEGTKLEGFQSTEKKRFGNKRLNEAADMMSRELETEKRLLNTGSPWWFMFAGLMGLVVFIGGALVKMDATTSGKKSTVDAIARIQQADWLSVLSASAGTACALVATFASIAILFTAFFESAKQGLLCFFVPFYVIYYMFSRISSKRLFGTVMIFWVTQILAICLLGYALPRI